MYIYIYIFNFVFSFLKASMGNVCGVMAGSKGLYLATALKRRD